MEPSAEGPDDPWDPDSPAIRRCTGRAISGGYSLSAGVALSGTAPVGVVAVGVETLSGEVVDSEERAEEVVAEDVWTVGIVWVPDAVGADGMGIETGGLAGTAD